MLADVVNSSEVAMAVAALTEEVTPTMAELRHGSRLTQAAIPQPQGGAMSPHRSTAAEENTPDAADTSVSAASRAETNVQSGVEGIESQEESEKSVQGKVFQHADFQAFAEYVLESACFSLLQESAAGRWQDSQQT